MTNEPAQPSKQAEPHAADETSPSQPAWIWPLAKAVFFLCSGYIAVGGMFWHGPWHPGSWELLWVVPALLLGLLDCLPAARVQMPRFISGDRIGLVLVGAYLTSGAAGLAGYWLTGSWLPLAGGLYSLALTAFWTYLFVGRRRAG